MIKQKNYNLKKQVKVKYNVHWKNVILTSVLFTGLLIYVLPNYNKIEPQVKLSSQSDESWKSPSPFGNRIENIKQPEPLSNQSFINNNQTPETSFSIQENQCLEKINIIYQNTQNALPVFNTDVANQLKSTAFKTLQETALLLNCTPATTDAVDKVNKINYYAQDIFNQAILYDSSIFSDWESKDNLIESQKTNKNNSEVNSYNLKDIALPILINSSYKDSKKWIDLLA